MFSMRKEHQCTTNLYDLDHSNLAYNAYEVVGAILLATLVIGVTASMYYAIHHANSTFQQLVNIERDFSVTNEKNKAA